ncbi:MAG TPA: hypothetical protein VFQ61_22125 [Polyangiaceae bacterium]|nr:hypothetical protein [Polyangiaceae bacterium]
MKTSFGEVWRCIRLIIALSSLFLVGCSGRQACFEGESSVLTEKTSERTMALTRAGETVRTVFDIELASLPELWPVDGAVSSAVFSMAGSLHYVDAPDPTVMRELPRMLIWGRVMADATGDPSSSLPPPSSGTASVSWSTPLFGSCANTWNPGCCPFGARECKARVEFIVQRADGLPFPEVVLDWHGAATAQLNQCPEPFEGDLLISEVEGP